MPNYAKSVLLYSGGLDSYIANFLLKPDLNLYIMTGSKYEAKEIQHMVVPTFGALQFDNRLQLADIERPDLIVPNRNAFFSLIGSLYGDELYLAATVGDRSCDKDYTFADLMTKLMRHLWQEQHWTEARDVRLELPFKSMTKSKMVRDYLLKGGDVEKLRATISCYHGSVEQCGRCKPCARKWVALKNNGIETADIFESDPRTYFTDEMLEKARQGSYRGHDEDAEILEAVGA